LKPLAWSAAAWRWFVVVLALLATAQLAIEVYHAPRVLRLGLASEPLFSGGFLRERGPTTFVVASVPAGSPLAAAGVVPGDRVRFDAPLGRWYNLAVGDRVALTVVRGDTSHRIDVTAAPAAALPRYQVANYVMDFAGRVGALLLGVVIGWRRPSLIAYRALAAAGLTNALAFPYSAPVDAHVAWLDYLASLCQELGPGTIVFFALNYPDDRPSGWRARLKRFYPWLFGAYVAVEILYFARLYAGYYEPSTSWLSRLAPVVFAALFFWGIFLAWRNAYGESRVRLQWILATVGTIMAAVLSVALNYLAGNPIPPEVFALIANAAVLAAEVGLVYAVLRRRIFDFGFAVNRTLVFGIVGAILLGTFQLAHAIVGEFLHFDDKNKTILLSAILSLAVYLSFNQLRKVVEKVVDRLFFNRWVVSEDELKDFVAQAKHATDAAALSRLLVAAVDRFTEDAGCAVYRRVDDGSYRRGDVTLADAPAAVGDNDEVVLAMRARNKALPIRETSPQFHAALALPMGHRGALPGFALVGARRDREPYRPDQVEALERAVHEVGLDFYALELAHLEHVVDAERRTSETLRAQLQTAITLAKSDPLRGRA
jgi:hypothetical protein